MNNKKQQIDRIISLAKQYNVTRLLLFGSFLENDSKANDIDLACDGVVGWKLYELASKIENELNISIDLVPLTPSNSFTNYIAKKGKVLI